MSVFYGGGGQGRERGCTTLRLVLFYKPLECLFWTLPTPADKKRRFLFPAILFFFKKTEVRSPIFPKATLCNHRRTPGYHSKSERTPTQKGAYWCNGNKLRKKGLDVTSSHCLHWDTDLRIQKSVTTHCIIQNSKEEFSSSGLQVSQGQQI